MRAVLRDAWHGVGACGCIERALCCAVAAHSFSAGVAEVLDTQAAAAASSPLAIVFTVTLASAVLYIALT